MKNVFLFLVLTFFFGIKKSHSQNKELCICFEKGNPYIKIRPNENSIHTDFSIVKPGYETKEQRQKAIAKYRKGPPVLPPVFYITYFSTKKPIEFDSVKNIDCTGLVNLKEFRNPNFKRPPNTSSVSFIFIQKISKNKFLKWEVIQNAIE